MRIRVDGSAGRRSFTRSERQDRSMVVLALGLARELLAEFNSTFQSRSGT